MGMVTIEDMVGDQCGEEVGRSYEGIIWVCEREEEEKHDR